MNNHRICAIGWPSRLGGADTELYQQMFLWRKLGVEVHIIRPVMGKDAIAKKLADELIKDGFILHEDMNWSKIDGMPVISYCSGDALKHIEEIRKHTKTFIFVNCMTWLFPKEIECVQNGFITHELYQREEVMNKQMLKLKAVNPNIIGDVVKPYFRDIEFPYIDRDTEYSKSSMKFGRLSRNDPSKFHKHTVQVYEAMVAPKTKEGIMLGVNKDVLKKIGLVPDWIKHYPAGHISQQDFYRFCSFLIQPCDVNHMENLPRISFEAMSSGTLLIVDNKGGFKDQVIHGETGWLCNDLKDYVYYSSRAAYEFNESEQMRKRARSYLLANWGESSVIKGWKEYFSKVGVL